jgi:hypothetical protein
MTKPFVTNQAKIDSANKDPFNNKRNLTFLKLIPIIQKTASSFIRSTEIGIINEKEIALCVTLQSSKENDLLLGMKKFIIACGQGRLFSCSESSDNVIFVSIMHDKLEPISKSPTIKKCDFKNFFNPENQTVAGDPEIQHFLEDIRNLLSLSKKEENALAVFMRIFVERHKETATLKKQISDERKKFSSFRNSVSEAIETTFLDVFRASSVEITTFGENEEPIVQKLTVKKFNKLVNAKL